MSPKPTPKNYQWQKSAIKKTNKAIKEEEGFTLKRGKNQQQAENTAQKVKTADIRGQQHVPNNWKWENHEKHVLDWNVH